ncbi:hypothetical protein [Flavonifractor sp. HCP28S3_F3]|uniref:helix-turn-helix domain-containing protein n=1 Tax=Flavonifractor sp. HCP28S3_F3 TaxID=3438939 RepID=UPI003F8C525E
MSPKKKAIATYLREHPGVSSKAMIARELQIDRSTVQRYYDEIREKFQRQGWNGRKPGGLRLKQAQPSQFLMDQFHG